MLNILSLYYNGNLAAQEDYDKNHMGWDGERCLSELSGEIYRAYQED